MQVMGWISYIAKALTALLVAVLAGIVSQNVEVNPWVIIGIAGVIELLAVFLVPNGEKPTS